MVLSEVPAGELVHWVQGPRTEAYPFVARSLESNVNTQKSV